MYKFLLGFSIGFLALVSVFDVEAMTGTGCTFSKTYTTIRGNNIYDSVSCYISGTGLVSFGKSVNNGGSWSNPTSDFNNFQTEKYGPMGQVWFNGCTNMANPPTQTGACTGFNTVISLSGMLRQGPQGDPGSNGATGATGATGPQGNDGYSAYEIAQILGFSGNVTDWQLSLVGPRGDTGAVDFSNMSGTVSLQNVINLPDNDATLDSSGTYIPLTSSIDGTTYINMDSARNISFIAIIFSIMMIVAYIIYKKQTKVF